MAQDVSLEGLRSQIIHSYDGRKDGRDKDEFSLGLKDIRLGQDGWKTAGTTIVSTSYGVGTAGSSYLQPFGVSVVGATGASATTGYMLGVPVPGVYKTLINPTTGYAVINTTAAGAFIASTGSATSTHGNITMGGKGCNIQMFALTTALWAALTQQYSSVSTNIVIA